ncbi:OmpA family protein, partial [Acetobacter nitrogenifigens]|uniref:OmpA-like domain-containing protein n=1 Tax=Acetobacter nitrogenifigens DSM 23921 = NBRC 105050 TaxID=1120919 RepID=A0A511XB71_9PROT
MKLHFCAAVSVAAVLTGGVALVAPLSVRAQVTTNPDALDSITPEQKPRQEASASGHKALAQRSARVGADSSATVKPAAASQLTAPEKPVDGAVAAASGKSDAQPQASAPAKPVAPGKPPPPPTIPPAPPPIPILTPPPTPVDLHPFPNPADPPAVKDAQGAATPIDGGVRITFAAKSFDLNAETRDAVLAFVKALQEKPDSRALIDAIGSGAPNDPSRPRRMALQRGLAVRAVLMNAGVPSTRIYVRVLPALASPSPEPADRVDIRRSDAVP